MLMSKTILAAGLFALTAASANAAVVTAIGTTAAGPFTVDAGSVVAASDQYDAWDLTPSTPASEWIWSSANNFAHTFTYKFDLTGFLASSATIAGLIGFDDDGEIALNGNVIFSANGGDNYSKIANYASSLHSLFANGVNTLTITDRNIGGKSAGIRATVVVEATPSAVPVPASLPLLGGALAAFGFIARRKRRAA